MVTGNGNIDAEGIEPAPMVGDVFHSECCYSGVYHSFYEVVGVSATGRTVKLRELAADDMGGESWRWSSCPTPGRYLGDVVLTRRVLVDSDGRLAVNVSKYGTLAKRIDPSGASFESMDLS